MQPRAALFDRIVLPLLAAGFLVPAFFLLRRSLSADLFEALGYGFLGVGLLVAGSIPLAVMISRRTGQRLGSAIFFPADENDRPPPVYGVAETRRANGDHEEAMRLLDDIADEHPQAVRTYVLMIDIAVMNLRDAARAEAACRRGLTALRSEDDRATLLRMYEAIRSRLDVPPPPGPIPVATDADGHVRRAPPA